MKGIQCFLYLHVYSKTSERLGTTFTLQNLSAWKVSNVSYTYIAKPQKDWELPLQKDLSVWKVSDTCIFYTLHLCDTWDCNQSLATLKLRKRQGDHVPGIFKADLKKLYSASKPRIICLNLKFTNIMQIVDCFSNFELYFVKILKIIKFLVPDCMGDYPSGYISVPFNKGLFLKERICSLREQILPFKNSP